MKEYKIAVIPGDGIGIEVVESAIEVITKPVSYTHLRAHET